MYFFSSKKLLLAYHEYIKSSMWDIYSKYERKKKTDSKLLNYFKQIYLRIIQNWNEKVINEQKLKTKYCGGIRIRE